MRKKQRATERPQWLGFEYDTSGIRPTIERTYRKGGGWPSAVIAALLFIIISPIVLSVGLLRRRRGPSKTRES